MSSIFDKLESAGVLAVLVIDNAADAVPLAEALLAGGVNAMELTLRTDAAIDALNTQFKQDFDAEQANEEPEEGKRAAG